MEKYIKFTLITLFLISSFKYSNTAACNAATTQADCTGNTTCEWTATPSCKGATACTASTITDKTTCEAAKTGCTYTAADGSTPHACANSGTACTNGFTDKATCENCQWDTTQGTCKEKTGGTENPDDEDFGSSLKFSGLIALLSLLF